MVLQIYVLIPPINNIVFQIITTSLEEVHNDSKTGAAAAASCAARREVV
jgi:hypothetical protein